MLLSGGLAHRYMTSRQLRPMFGCQKFEQKCRSAMRTIEQMLTLQYEHLIYVMLRAFERLDDIRVINSALAGFKYDE